jgi:hypothetical protein
MKLRNSQPFRFGKCSEFADTETGFGLQIEARMVQGSQHAAQLCPPRAVSPNFRPSRTPLRRDCEFLTSCGYAVDHVPLPDGRKYGWLLAKDGANGRRLPAEEDGAAATQPVLIDIERIRKVTPLDTTFTPRDARFEDVIPEDRRLACRLVVGQALACRRS